MCLLLVYSVYKAVVFSKGLNNFQEKMLEKKLSWHWSPFSALLPSCQWPFSCTSAYFPGDWTRSPFIFVFPPHCWGLQLLFISTVNSAQRCRCSHANIDLSDWTIFYHTHSRWGQLLSLQHMSNLCPPDHSIYFLPFLACFWCIVYLCSFYSFWLH